MSVLTPQEKALLEEASITTNPLMHVPPSVVRGMLNTIADLRAKVRDHEAETKAEEEE